MKDHEEIILNEVIPQLEMALAKHQKHNSPHESFAVLLEEVDELWDLVKQRNQNKGQMRKEAVQVAAMAIRFVHDVCLG